MPWTSCGPPPPSLECSPSPHLRDAEEAIQVADGQEERLLLDPELIHDLDGPAHRRNTRLLGQEQVPLEVDDGLRLRLSPHLVPARAPHQGRDGSRASCVRENCRGPAGQFGAPPHLMVSRTSCTCAPTSVGLHTSVKLLLALPPGCCAPRSRSLAAPACWGSKDSVGQSSSVQASGSWSLNAESVDTSQTWL